MLKYKPLSRRTDYIYTGEPMDEIRHQEWIHDLQDFISYWNQELDDISRRKVDSDECSEIMDSFHKNMDFLLLRRPADIVEEDFIGQLRPLLNKLDSSLAMALCSVKFENTT